MHSSIIILTAGDARIAFLVINIRIRLFVAVGHSISWAHIGHKRYLAGPKSQKKIFN